MPGHATFGKRRCADHFRVPFFVIQGQDDTRTPPEAARAFVNQLRAPAKGFTTNEGGHFACFTNPIGFLNALDSDMRSVEMS